MAAATSTHATNVHLIKNLSYDPVKNFTPIVESVETIGCIVVNTSVVPVNSIAELVANAKANPGKLSFGSSGAGSFFHLAGELFNQVNGVNLAHVPYRGSVAAFTDLIGGHIQVNFTQLSQAVAYRDNKHLKVLACWRDAVLALAGVPSIPGAAVTKMPPTWNVVGPSALPSRSCSA
jgi:tripartite-type tricarboxylate transporter receptor subunit TctC